MSRDRVVTNSHEDMGIRILRYKDSYRPYWYAEYKENGTVHQIRLTEKIMGVPPTSLSIKDEGSALYEKSKARAQAEFDAFEAARKRKGASERLMEELIASKTGEKVTYHRLKDLGKLWNELPREKPLSQSRIDNNLYVASQFANFCTCEYLYEVKVADVKGFMAKLKEDGDAWTTIMSKLNFLSGAFKKFYRGEKNPFGQVIKRNTDQDAQTIHRRPLLDEQIEALRDEARGDELLYPLLECGLATGARLIDIAHMRKDNIDFREGFITYIASKTGTLCEVPLFDEFRKVCECIINSSDPDDPYLFPEAAYMYDTNRTGLCERGKRLFAKALFKDVGESPKPTLIIDGKPKERLTTAEVYTLIDKQRYKPSKAQRMKSVYDLYVVQKKSYRIIEGEIGLPRSTITDYMQAIEELTGDPLIRFDIKHGHIAKKLEKTRERRSNTKRAVSIYGWSCLRSTFCRLAIERGVDEKMIMKAAGHANFKTTMTYYDNPTRAHQRELMKAKMATTAIGRKVEPTPLVANLHSLIEKLPPEQQKLLEANLKVILGKAADNPMLIAESA